MYSILFVFMLIQATCVHSNEDLSIPIDKVIKERFKNVPTATWTKMLTNKRECGQKFHEKFKNRDQLDKICCMQIFINNCFEDLNGLSLHGSLFLEATTYFKCLPYLEDTQKKCNVDTVLHGMKMVAYSRVFIKVNHMHAHTKMFDMGQFANGTELQEAEASLANLEYCCLKKAVCDEFDRAGKGDCQSFDKNDLKETTIADYCDCTQFFPVDQDICKDVWTRCNRTISLKSTFEFKNPPYFWLVLGCAMVFNCLIYWSCCTDVI